MRKEIKHNPIAKLLASSVFKQRIVKSKKSYNRKNIKINLKDYTPAANLAFAV